MTPADRARALRMARDALEAALLRRPPLPVAGEDRPPFSDPGACFVTLRGPGGTLRGCLGTIEAFRPLAEEIRTMTVASATRDPRFVQVEPAELPDLSISISVLSPMTRVPDVSHVQVGVHGVMVKLGPYRGVLLPQVATEQQWDAETFLRETCRKAGLPAWATDDPNLEIDVFSAEVFGES